MNTTVCLLDVVWRDIGQRDKDRLAFWVAIKESILSYHTIPRVVNKYEGFHNIVI